MLSFWVFGFLGFWILGVFWAFGFWAFGILGVFWGLGFLLGDLAP